ncbi:uncharacterized protein LOC134264107 [Saccostrea cucullata]|uniref:uncharacterized protein LOC134264107 n=1 Tax=Saccostrea cuccullata TaxID=36930 RepID=UPI002ED1F743
MSLQEIQGDLLHCEVEAIVHQCNCLTVKAHGLSQSLAEKFPQANLYATRRPLGTRNLAVEEDRGIPGTIKVFPSQTPVVICLLAQWDYGKASHRPKRISTYQDTPQNREQWFQACLQEMGESLPYQTYAFPYKIACGLAQGNWIHYRHYIEQFEDQHPGFTSLREWIG